MKTFNILVADDHPLLRKALLQLLTGHFGWNVVGEAATGKEVVDKAQQTRPDLVILDISMPELNGVDTARMIAHILPKTHVLLLTMHNDEDLIASAFQAGVRGYVLKTETGRDLLNAVEAVLAGRTFFPAEASELLRHSDNALIGKKKAKLTVRESQVLQLLAEGKRNKEIAVALNISPRTAENHRARIMERLDCRSLSDLVRYAIRNKMLQA